MITPYQKPEGKDDKADNFWQNLAGKLGLRAPLMRQASVTREQLLSDGITTVGSARRDGVSARPDALVQRVAEQGAASKALIDRYAGVFHRAVAELGQSERVKAADRLSRIEEDMAAFKDKLLGLGGEPAMTDLVGEVSVRADAVSGACVQLRAKTDGLSMAQAEAIENAFLILSDAKSGLDKIKGGQGPGAPGADLGLGDLSMPDLELVDGDIPEEPTMPTDGPEGPSPIAGHTPSFTKKAADMAYDDLRGIHTKLILVDSMLNAIVSELNVGSMLGPAPMDTPGMPPAGMPPMEEMEGEQKEPTGADLFDEMEHDHLPAAQRGRVKVAASGDPGDTEPGNTIYKDLNKCRDCVWFESDWTHETYRDKCKHCTHASLGGAVEHFWPRSQQMIVWMPQWGAPEATANKVRLSGAFVGTLSLHQEAGTVSAQVAEIARQIVASVKASAVELGSAFVAYLQDPLLERTMPKIAHEVAGEIERQTGIEIAITASKARAWGHHKLAIRIPKDFAVQPLKPGQNPPGKTTCGTCGLSWDDDKPTSWTPAPSARCPFEYYHDAEPEMPDNSMGIGGTASKNGEVIIACDPSLVIEQTAKGEKRKIKELREQLQGEKDPAKIKTLNDAIDSLYSRMDQDKERKQKRRDERDERKKKDQEALDKEPAQLPSASAKFVGTLRSAEGEACAACGRPAEGWQPCSQCGENMCLGCYEENSLGTEGSTCGKCTVTRHAAKAYCDACDRVASKCICKKANKLDHEDGGKHDPAKDMSHGLGRGQGHTKNFKVVAVSTNTNSFGLYGVILMSQDGEAWRAAHGQLELPQQGDTIKIDLGAWGASGFEIPEKLPPPPPEVLAQVWGEGDGDGGQRGSL